MNLYFFNLIHQFAGQFWPLDWVFIFLADYLGYILLALIAAWAARGASIKQKFLISAFMLLALVISGTILAVGRFSYDSPRPFVSLGFKPLIAHENSSSFPSAHAIIFFTLGFAVFFLDRKIGYWFLFAAFLIGLARIFVGVHWPLDILGGAIFGFLSVYIAKNLIL